MKDKENASKDKNDSKIPKSSRSRNTYKDFNKICRAYYDELIQNYQKN